MLRIFLIFLLLLAATNGKSQSFSAPSGNDYLHKARDAYRAKDFNTAIRYNRLARAFFLKQNNRPGAVKATNYLARTFLEISRADSAEYYLLKGLKLADETLPENHLLKATIENSYGMLNYETGNYALAQKYFKYALDIRLANNKIKTVKILWTSYNNLGNVLYKRGNVIKAITNYKKALTFASAVNNKYGKITALNNLAKCYLHNNQPHQALDYLEKSAELFREKAATLFYYGKAWQLLKDDSKAEKYFKEALDIRKNKLPPHNYLLSETYLALGDLYDKQAHFQQAQFYYAIALKNQILNSKTEQAQILYNVVSVKVLHKLARAEFELSRRQNSKKLLWNAAERMATASKILDFLKMDYINEASRLFIAKEGYEIYADYTDILFALLDDAHSSQLMNTLFNVTERTKAFMLFSDIHLNTTLKHFPEFIQTKERYFIQQARNFSLSWGKRTAFHATAYMAFIIEYKDFLAGLKKNYPRYYALMLNPVLPKLSSVQRRLDKKTVILNYFLTDLWLYVQTISKDRTTIMRRKLPANFNPRFDALLKSLRKFNRGMFNENITLVSDVLMGAIRERIQGKRTLIIIPSGRLFYLPFEILQLKNNSGERVFLIEKYKVKYNYSVSLFNSMQIKNSNNKDFDLITAAPFTHRKLSGQFYLPYSADEIADIKRCFSGYKIKSLTAKELNKQFFTSAKLSSRILHFATHTVINDAHYYKSRIILSPDSSKNLFLADVFNLTIKPDLVVLSSCESGLGKLNKGEGLLSLQRAFLFKGVNNIVFSLWKVFDKNTAMLMKHFYCNLKDGQNFTDALRMAKLQILHNKKYQFPGFWGGFIIVGN